MAKFCQQCGTPLEPGVKFCPKCGAAVMDGEQQPSPESPSTKSSMHQKVDYSAQEVGLKEKYLSFTGRLNRKPYILRGLVLWVLSLVLSGASSALEDAGSLILLPVVAIGVVVLVGSFSLGIRRCHDLNRTGWMMLLIFIPLVNIFFAIYLMFFHGTEGDNKYGADPLG